MARLSVWDTAVSGSMVRAGDMDAELDGIALHDVRRGPVRVLSAIYPAVRDETWGTVPAEVSDLERRSGSDSFRVAFGARHEGSGIDFEWIGEIEGLPDGTITYTMDGRARAAFHYGRIGLNVLHPASRAGCAYRGTSPSGTLSGRLPRLIGPQPFEDGAFHGLIGPFTSLTVEIDHGLSIQTDFHGDLFELEDQRNWTDASFKIYSTPVHLGTYQLARRGQSFRQRLVISCVSASRVSGSRLMRSRLDLVELRLDVPTARVAPAIGLVTPDRETGYSERERTLLRELGPAHLRTDVRLGDRLWRTRLRRAAAQASALGCPLELGILLATGDEPRLGRFASFLSDIPIARIHVFDLVSTAAPPAVARALQAKARRDGRGAQIVRAALRRAGLDAPVGGGTDDSFAELNRARPAPHTFDHLVYAISPQVHVTDDRSIMETLPIQRQTLECAQSFWPERPLIVGPVQLRRSFNPNAPRHADGEATSLPGSVDVRQMSLFAAAWTLGSIRELTLGGARALTYFETTGWRGIMESETGSPLPHLFPSIPGAVFPVYHVLADVRDLSDGDQFVVTSSVPEAVCGLAARSRGQLLLIVTNLTASIQRVGVPVGASERVRVRMLDERSKHFAQIEPARFRRGGDLRTTVDGVLTMELAPYAIARVDA